MEIFRPYGFDKTLFGTTLALIAVGLIMVFSTSAILSIDKYRHPFHFFFPQLIGAAAGLILILLMLPIRKPFYKNPTFIYGLLFLTFLLLLLCFFMPAFNKTNRWIALMNMRFQPSELAKISLILFFASFIDRKKDTLHEIKSLFLPLAVLVLFILLIIKQPDYGTAILVFLICSIMLFIGGVKLLHFIVLGIPFAALFIFFLFQKSYVFDRILAFIAPTRDPLGDGFQIIQSKMAVGSGGLFGASFGAGTQKLFFLPCAHTDYIYAIVGEELGLVGAASVLLLFFIFLWRGLLISWKAPDLFSQLAAAGITLAIFSQALMNISIVLGLGPPTGLPLPLLSFGRSSLISSLFSIGILLHISQRKSSARQKK